MHRTERLVIYAALAACLVLGLRAAQTPPANAGQQPTQPPTTPATPAAAAAPAPAAPPAPPAPAIIATCDVYDLIEKLVISDRYEPARQGEEARIRDRLKLIEDELLAMEEALKNADPADPAAQLKAGDFQKRRNDYSLLRGQAQQDFTDFVASQYIHAYDEVRKAVAKVAAELGCTHVISSRSDERTITATDPERLVEAFLGRPMVFAPTGTDISEAVREELKIK